MQGSGEYDDLVATVQLFKTNPNPIPPPPPKDTNPGYNDVLDLPRPSTIDNYLKFYDTVFLIDDSGSMANDSKWTELNNALIGISGTAIDYDADGIDLYFLNSNNKFKFREEIHGVDDKPKVAAAMAKVTPSGGTPTGLRTHERMREYLDRLNAAVGTPRYSEIKPLDLICITDGVPSTSLLFPFPQLSSNARASQPTTPPTNLARCSQSSPPSSGQRSTTRIGWASSSCRSVMTPGPRRRSRSSWISTPAYVLSRSFLHV